MSRPEKAKQEYLKQTRSLLSGYPEVLCAFEQLWQDGKLREAYLRADEAVSSLQLIRSPEHRKADEEFYWEFVN